MRVGLRHARRPAQRRQVDAAQPHPRHEGHDRVGQAPDHRGPQVRRRARTRPDAAGRCSSTRPASTSRARRSASGSTTRPPDAIGGRRRRVPAWSTPPRRSAGATSASRRGCPTDAVVVVNKIDRAAPERGARASSRRPPELDLDEYFPVSARTGDGVPALVERAAWRACPRARSYYPDDMVTDVPEAFWVAELVREQLLAVARDELPHSIATRVTEWEWPRIRCEILVERDSQKGIVIGKGARAQAGRHSGARAAAPGRLPRAVREGRQGLAAPPQGARAPRLLSQRPVLRAHLTDRLAVLSATKNVDWQRGRPSTVARWLISSSSSIRCARGHGSRRARLKKWPSSATSRWTGASSACASVNKDKDYERELPTGLHRRSRHRPEAAPRRPLRCATPDGPDAVGPLYTRIGTDFHNRPGAETRSSSRWEAGFPEYLAEIGLTGDLAAAANDERWDDVLEDGDRARRSSASARDVGTPILTFCDGGASFFGPVLSRIPRGDEAVELFDSDRLSGADAGHGRAETQHPRAAVLRLTIRVGPWAGRVVSPPSSSRLAATGGTLGLGAVPGPAHRRQG